MKESKYQEALEWLSDKAPFDKFSIGQHQWCCETLQSLVDKSIPMKVNGMINDWACANCDSDRGIIEDKPYCAVCGQKLDWSDSNE